MRLCTRIKRRGLKIQSGLYGEKCEVKVETVKRRFQMLIDQVKILEYKASYSINAGDLESLIQASGNLEATMIFVKSTKNSLKIVGWTEIKSIN